MNYTYYEQKAKAKGKTLLIEKAIFSIKEKDIEFLPKAQLVESSGVKYECRAVVRNVPVTRFTENANERIYPQKLWEKVYKEGSAENNLSLMDHPEDEGSVKNICGVWHNFRLTEDNGIADWYLVGDNGQLLSEVLKAGGAIGLSSVGYGELEESDGKTVKWDTYELERLSDAVLDPSQGVHATIDNIAKEQEFTESEIKTPEKPVDSNLFIESVPTNKLDQKNSQVGREDKNMERFQEVNLKNHVNALLKDLYEEKDYGKAIRVLEGVDTGDSEVVQQKVNNAIAEFRAKLSEEKTATENTLASTKAELAELKVKYESACSMANELKEKYNKAKSIVEKAGLGNIDNITVLTSNSKKMKEDINQLIKDRRFMESDIKHLLNDRKNMESDIRALVEDRKLMLFDIKKLVEDRKTMREDIKALIEKHNSLIKKYKALKEEGEVDENGEPLEFSLNEPVEEEDEFSNVPVNNSAANNSSNFANEPVEEDEFSNIPVEDEETEFVAEDDEMIDIPVEDEEEFINVPVEEEAEFENIPVEDDEFANEPVVEEDEFSNVPVEDEEEFPVLEDEEEMIEPVNASINNSSINNSAKNNAAVQEQRRKAIIKKQIAEYFANEVRKYPALKVIREAVMRSESIVAAVNKVDKFKAIRSQKEKPVRIKESTNSPKAKRPSWLGDNRF